MDIGYNISKYRKLNNLSQEEFAFRINVSKQTIYKWENGISVPNCDKVYIICKVLKISYENLFEENDT